LVGREARRELKEALVHVLGAEASSEAALTVDKHRQSHLTVAGLRCRSPPIKVSISIFPRRYDPVGGNLIENRPRSSRILELQ
jgi:hypothetical protein